MDVVVESPPLTGSSTGYNITFNLTSLFTFPSRFFARMRRVDDFFTSAHMQGDSDSPIVNLDEWNMSRAAARGAEHVQTPAFHQTFPSPWAFFTSWYAIGLFILAVLIHRLQNIVALPRQSQNHIHRNHSFRSRRTPYSPLNILRSAWSNLLPLNLSRTTTRFVFYMPSLFYLSKMLCTWFILLMQGFDLIPSQSATLLNRLSQTISSLEFADICWSTFCAVCMAFCADSLVKTLELGAGTVSRGGIMAGGMAIGQTNLVGYAFLLHIYSSPVTHLHENGTESTLPTRPDKHVIISILIPLIQLTLLNVLQIYKPISHHRLVPTFISSFLSLLHFHSTLWFGFGFNSDPTPLTPSDPDSNLNATMKIYRNPYTSPFTTLPILNYIPNIFETVLLATILLTIALNALVQLLALGSVERVLVGLVPTSSRGGSGRWDWVRWDEDFGSLLFRVGTASLEATGLRGWGNEVAGVVASVSGGGGGGSERRAAKEYGVLEVNRAGVMNITHATIVTTTSNEGKGKTTALDSGTGVGRRRRIRTQHGYMNEIRTVNVRTYEQNSGSGWGWGWRGPEGGVGEWGWYLEMWKFGKQVLVCLLGLGALVWNVVSRKKFWVFGREVEDENEEENGDAGREEVDDERAAAEAVTYERFLRGEDVSDDEGEWEEGLSDDSEDMDDTISEEGAGHLSQEAVGLYTDLASTSGAESSDGNGLEATTLLAHMTHQGGSPLTRRKYRTLVHREGGGEDEELFGRTGGGSVPTSKKTNVDRDEEESRRNCVICTVEARQIICWPCRCLAICDDCRENLASRSSPHRHRCPCCRQSVEGYSRIFIP